jgi:tRNA-modifying protein YgfZ
MNAFCIELDHMALVCFRGEDSVKFLQGQLTCDVAALGMDNATLGACCNVKGRIIANFLLLKTSQGLFLELPSGSDQLLLEHLRKFMVFYKQCEVVAHAENFLRLGFWGAEAGQHLAQHWHDLPSRAGEAIQNHGHWLVLLPGASIDSEPRYEVWIDRQSDTSLLEVLTANIQQGSRQDWDLLNMRGGVFLIDPTKSGEYTPQLLNFDLNGGVSFNKGCYTGQEIVARMHFRGNAKKRLHYLASSGLALEQTNMILNGPTGDIKAELVHGIYTNTNWQALVLVNSDEVPTGGDATVSMANSIQATLKTFRYECVSL